MKSPCMCECIMSKYKCNKLQSRSMSPSYFLWSFVVTSHDANISTKNPISTSVGQLKSRAVKV